jgi:hypothetical protein
VREPREAPMPLGKNGSGRRSSPQAPRGAPSGEPRLSIHARSEPSEQAIWGLIDEWLVPALIAAFLREHHIRERPARVSTQGGEEGADSLRIVPPSGSETIRRVRCPSVGDKIVV